MEAIHRKPLFIYFWLKKKKVKFWEKVTFHHNELDLMLDGPVNPDTNIPTRLKPKCFRLRRDA